jgi:hypothetical protein
MFCVRTCHLNVLLDCFQASDVTEAISFFVSAFEFGLLNAMMGVRQMLALIFSREITIQVSQNNCLFNTVGIQILDIQNLENFKYRTN